MAYRFVDHTAELQLELEAASRAEVLEEAVRALAELLGDDEAEAGEPVTLELSIRATDAPALLAAWIDEIVFVAENDGLVPRRAGAVEAGETEAHGTVTFARGTVPHLVKGVTYHELRFERDGDRWHGRVVLDV